MHGWRLGFLGIEVMPPWLGEFEVDQFFRLRPAEIATPKRRRGTESHHRLALQIGFFWICRCLQRLGFAQLHAPYILPTYRYFLHKCATTPDQHIAIVGEKAVHHCLTSLLLILGE